MFAHKQYTNSVVNVVSIADCLGAMGQQSSIKREGTLVQADECTKSI